MMKRFIYDALLLFILVMIGMSLDDSSVYVNKQEELKQFEKEVINEAPVDTKEESQVMNQVEDNKASIAAQNISEVIKGFIKTFVLFLNSIFESITKT